MTPLSGRKSADVTDARFWLIFTKSGQAVDIARDSEHADDMRDGGWQVVEVVPAPESGHVHKWQANGQLHIRGEAPSPVSQLDDTLYTKVYSSMVCECGMTKNVHIANEDVRRRGARS
jgi:hypothetical protein